MWKYKDNVFQKREICNFLTFLMQELQSRGQITNDVTSLLFGKSHSILNMVQQLSSMNLFKDEVEPVSLFKILNQLDDVLMASAMMKGFNLFENTRSRVSRDFICKNDTNVEKSLLGIVSMLWRLTDDFNGKFLVRPDVPTSTYGRVSPLAKNFVGHMI